MTTYNPGDVIYAWLQYVDYPEGKRRPLLVVLDAGDQDVVVARITGHPPRDAYDIRITQLTSAGLPKASTIRLSKIATIPRATIIKKLGKLSSADRDSVRHILQNIANDFNS